ncbi:MAG TPA: hypothetical protein PL117_17285, partial [Accumulibacter sp.]|nr:hypothetical protein [Accumulibacter sp.]
PPEPTRFVATVARRASEPQPDAHDGVVAEPVDSGDDPESSTSAVDGEGVAIAPAKKPAARARRPRKPKVVADTV